MKQNNLIFSALTGQKTTGRVKERMRQLQTRKISNIENNLILKKPHLDLERTT
jgi:hypothetical protein